ncbi:MAG: DNA pilot protein [Microviridae sp.]|nr:MAG: DNA pilot protein [Microviridae sp.]
MPIGLDIASQVGDAVSKVGGGLVGGLASQATTTGMGLLTNWLTNRSQLNQNQKLIQQQEEYNKRMTEFNKNEQLDLWNKTGYAAQVRQMKEAGINPALMFKTGGSAGSTAIAAAGSSQPSAMGNAGMSIENQMSFRQKQEKQDEEIKKIKEETENIILEGVIKKYTGLDLKDVYERIKVPNRGIEEKTYEDELQARQGIADTIYEQWLNGNLEKKSNAEVTAILKNNAKTDAQIAEIDKRMKKLEEETKGAQLSNILLEVETQWAQGTGLQSKTATDVIMKLIGLLMGTKIGNPIGKIGKSKTLNSSGVKPRNSMGWNND